CGTGCDRVGGFGLEHRRSQDRGDGIRARDGGTARRGRGPVPDPGLPHHGGRDPVSHGGVGVVRATGPDRGRTVMTTTLTPRRRAARGRPATPADPSLPRRPRYGPWLTGGVMALAGSMVVAMTIGPA